MASSRRLAALALVAFLAPASAPAGPCGCADMKDMVYRIKEANALIAAYRNQIRGMESKEAATGQPLLYTSALYAGTLQPREQAVADAVRQGEPGAHPNTATATTAGNACTTVITGGSPCLREAIARHEAHHANVCSLRKGSLVGDLVTGFDYRNSMRLADVAQEEIVAYYLEIAYLTGELAKLPDGCKPPNWFLHFEVTVAGHGEKSRGADSSLSWKVRHVYAGDLELSDPKVLPRALSPAVAKTMAGMSPLGIMAVMAKLGKVRTWRYVAPPVTLYAPITVEIDDEVRTSEHDPGEGGSFEDTRTVHTWKSPGPVEDQVQDVFRLEVDEAGKLYNISLAIAPMGRAQTIDDVTTRVIDRSKYGYGDAPMHEAPPPVTKQVPPATFQIPQAAPLLVDAQVHHPEDLPFEPREDLFTFDSGDLPMDPKSGFLANLPGAEKNLKVRICYSLSKLPIR